MGIRGTSRHVVVGLGEVGSALKDVLCCDGYDKDDLLDKEYFILHICIPYTKQFVDIVKEYQKKTNCFITVVHSTVPIGTCEQLGAIHSPIRGVHPNLKEGIETFVKYFGGEGTTTKIVMSDFNKFGITTEYVGSSKTSEAIKLWDTTIYGVNIELEKFIHAYCEGQGVDFKYVYTNANQTYNDGYERLGKPQFKKYILKHIEGPIGGHCVEPNKKLLGFESKFRIR